MFDRQAATAAFNTYCDAMEALDAANAKRDDLAVQAVQAKADAETALQIANTASDFLDAYVQQRDPIPSTPPTPPTPPAE